ncbi:DNA-3-methyladenine glycosylase family protein [Butyrivibrio sp. AE2032]|uniref:DNA-3-methyladenine glycosylase family protein n=1 Tax=Butyrivibrio sp. AE2032 TaxID=1458463 RepID=UPI0005551670|nr:DNA glycosylase [Butyrivibrio sp. AE2032]
MVLTIQDDFDLGKIADSGQCFRFNEVPGSGSGDAGVVHKRYSVAAVNRHLFVTELGQDKYEFGCSEDEFESFWKRYFDLDISYSQIRGKIDKKKDPYLYRASEYGKGIRILRQDPWEMLISFIISQRKNIPAIKASIEKLCALAGNVIADDPETGRIYSFPTPDKLAALSMEQLSGCSLGYRDKYVHQAALDVVSGAVDLSALEKVGDDKLMEELLKLFGVGVKVANCEILFGYHRLDAFPKDVWINRVLEEQYPQGFLFDKYAPYNGVMQQYLFFYSRSMG